MKLKEYEGKQLFKKEGITIPKGYIISSASQLIKTNKNAVIKAQILSGKRGKSGGVKIVTPSKLSIEAKKLLNKKINGFVVQELLIEEALDIKQEMYLGLLINGFTRTIQCVFSGEGGIDIEELSKRNPEKISKFHLYKGTISEINKQGKCLIYKEKIVPIIKKLFSIMKQYDAHLVEINPLVLTKKGLIAADSKVIIDDNALFRQQQFLYERKATQTIIEKKATKLGLHYVDLDGDISIIGDGAGLVMATLDILEHFGGKAADFLDVGGGASVKKMEQAMSLLQMKKSKGIFINIFGGITRCDEIAKGIIHYRDTHKLSIPMIVRMTGTNDAKARSLLTKNNIHSYNNMEQCAKKIVALSK